MAVPHSKSDDTLLKNLVPLNTLSDEQLGQLLSRIVVEKIKKGQYLFREGDTDHQNVYLLSGTIALLSGQKEMDLVSSGTQTARFALAHQLPRKHSAQARTAVTYVRIDSRMLSDMLARSHSASYEVTDIEEPTSGDWMSLLLQSPVFQQIPPANLQRVMMRMEEISVSAGDVIINQGDEGDYFYLISKGECVVTRVPEAGHAPVELAKLRAGKGFGEESLISDKPRGSNVAMLTDGVLVRLNKQDFIELVKQPLSRTVSYETACKSIDEGALWLDVRTPEEYEAGHLPGAINLPFFSLRFQASSLTMDRPYLVYGAEVGQSATAAYLLTERGAEVFVLDIGWVELEERAGLSEPSLETPANNVIDFNREADESGAGKAQFVAQQQEIEALKRSLEEQQQRFEAEQQQRHTEVKLLKQSLAVAKSRAEGGDQQAIAANEELRREVESLRASLRKAEEHAAGADGFKAEHDDLQERFGSLEQQLAAARDGVESAQRSRDEFRQQAVDQQAQLQQMRERYEEQKGRLTEEITELRLQLETADEVQQANHRQVGLQNDELDRLRGELAELQNAGEQYRAQSSEELAKLTGERFELECALEQLKEEQTQTQAAQKQQLESLQQALDEARESLAKSQTDLRERENALQQAQGEAEEAGELATVERAALKRQIEGLQGELRQHETEQQALLQEKEGLEERLQSGAARVAELEQTQQRTEAETASLRQELDKALEEARLHAAVEGQRLDAALVELGTELEAAKAEARAQQEKRVEMEALLEQEHQTAAFLKRSLKTAEEAVELTEKSLEERSAAQNELETQVAGLQQALVAEQAEKAQLGEQLQREVDEGRSLRQQASDRDAALQAARQALSDGKAELEREIDELRAQLKQQQEGREAALAEEEQATASLRQAFSEAEGAARAAETAKESLAEEKRLLESAKHDLEAKLADLEASSARRDEEVATLDETRQHELEALRGELEHARAAMEQRVDRGELEAAEARIAELSREIEGLREVQLEMASQLSDDADTEISQLRAALEAEEQKRRKVEKEARQSDVLRRERAVQETAIEMLNEDLETVGREKEALARERDRLVKQLNEIRGQYTELVNENDQLHTEMSGLREQATDSSLADNLLVQMEELRIKSDNLERERDESLAEAKRMRREAGELRSVIETYVEQIQDVQSFGNDEQVAALRTELDMVRRQAHEDLERMRQQLHEVHSRDSEMDGRDVDDVAAQQAIRQELVSLQQALGERDHLLRLSQNQCRTLEDAIEDRDKEVDQLKRKLELLLRKTGGLDDPSMQLGARQPGDPRLREGASEELGGDDDSKRSTFGRFFRKK